MRILQVVKRTAIRNRGHQRGKLQRRLLDLLAETGEHAHAAIGGGAAGKLPGVLARYIQAGLFAVSEQVSIIAELIEPHPFAQSGEIQVDGVGQGIGKVHAAGAARRKSLVAVNTFSLSAASATETLIVEQG